ncbi:MAG: hypothetical protein ACO23N_07035 [Opitutales bacterium]
MRFSACVALLTTALLASQTPGDSALVEAAEKAGAAVTPAVREAFLAESERRVIDELATVGVRLTPAQLDVVRKDPEARAACFGTVWPPDPRILLNLLEVREEVGPELYARQRRYLIAGSVARRLVGVGEAALGEKEEWALRGKAESESKGGRRHWPDYARFEIDETGDAGKSSEAAKKQPRARIVKKRQEREAERASKRADAEGLALGAAFLKSCGSTPAQVMASDELRDALRKAMGAHAPRSGGITHELMLNLMAEAGLRPAERDPFPSLADYARHLDGIRTRFPVRTAPWPLLMPLAKGWPIREAEDIGRRVADRGKLPTYGKYQGKELVLRARLIPSKWHWDSWQGTYQAGGVCHEMSTIGVGTYQALGVPATKTGQPHHSCVTIFDNSPKGYSVQIKQGTHGPNDTHTQWLFADPKVELPLAYHMGLALSMNVGLEAYIDTRIAVHLASMAEAAGKPALAMRILELAAARCAYNTEVWVGLARLAIPGEPALVRRTRVLRLLCEQAGASDSDLTSTRQRATDTDLSSDPDDPQVELPASWRANYVRTVSKEFLIEGITPTNDEAANRAALDNLRSCRGKAAPTAELIARFGTPDQPAR